MKLFCSNHFERQ